MRRAARTTALAFAALAAAAAPNVLALEGASPADPELALRSCDEALARGDAAAARSALKPAVSAHPQSYPLILRCAYVHYLLREYPKAASYYRRARDLGPREEAPYVGLFLVAKARGEPGWRKQAEDVLALNPAQRDANLALAYDHFERREYREALARYEVVLRALPGDPDALAGRGWCRVRLGERATAGVGACLAAINYRDNPDKRGATHRCLPLSFGYQRLSVDVVVSQTRVAWTPPAADTLQRDINVSLGWALSPRTSLRAAANDISSNDPATGGGQALTGGFLRTTKLDNGGSLVVGASGSYSQYRDLNLLQLAPRLGASRGYLYGELFAYDIQNTLTKQRFDSWGAAGALGPAGGFTVSARKWWGRKRGSVEEGGVVVYDSLTDTYLGGWQALATWTGSRRLSVYFRYGEDSILAEYKTSTVRYRSIVRVAGVGVRF